MHLRDKSRTINLGGTSVSLSRSTVVSSALAQRSERLRTWAALKLQNFFRRRLATIRARRELKMVLEKDARGIRGLRALVILGRTDGDVVRVWSESIASDDGQGYVGLFTSWRTEGEQESWTVLIRKVAWLLFVVVLKEPLRAISQRQVLTALLSPSIAGVEVSAGISQYLIERDFYGLLSCSISSTALNAQAGEPNALPYLIDLAVLPLSITSPLATLLPIFRNILTIPLLPNRLPTPSLILLSSKIPFSHLGQALDPDSVVAGATAQQKPHLIANLKVFVVPRYNQLDSGSLDVYVSLLCKLLTAVPKDILNPPVVKHIRRSSGVPVQSDPLDSDEEDAEETDTPAAPVGSPVSPRGHTREQIQLDSRTQKRISTLASAKHVSSLLRLPLSSFQLIGFLTALCAVWPRVKDVVLKAVVTPASPISFILRAEIFRWFIRLQESESESESESLASAAMPRRVRVRREHIAQDAYDRLSGVDLREPVRIVFVDRFKMEEWVLFPSFFRSIDGGGLFKEFLKELCKVVFDADRGLWLENSKNELHPNPHGYATE
ncbi:hypothetical protein H0H92_007386, partial [Tricholoma furcatifolium]